MHLSTMLPLCHFKCLEVHSTPESITMGFKPSCQRQHKEYSFAFLHSQLSLFLNWTIVDLQCYVSFSYTAKWFNNTHMHTHIFFFRFFSIIDYYKILDIVPCAVLFIHFIYSSVYLLSPNPQFIPLPTFPFSKHIFVFYVCESFCFTNRFICMIFFRFNI